MRIYKNTISAFFILLFSLFSFYSFCQNRLKEVKSLSPCSDTLKTSIKDAPSFYICELQQYDLQKIAYKKLCPTQNCMISIKDEDILKNIDLSMLYKTLLEYIANSKLSISYSGLSKNEILIITNRKHSVKNSSQSWYEVRVIESLCQNNSKVVPCTLKAEAKFLNSNVKNIVNAIDNDFTNILEGKIGKYIFKSIK